jgi:hypothetical protein
MALVNVSKEVPATAATPMSNLTCYYTVPTTSPPTLFAPLACAICVALFFFSGLGRGERREIATYHLSRLVTSRNLHSLENGKELKL